MRSLSIFSPKTTAGLALRADVLKLAESLGFEVRPDNALTQDDFFRALLCDDTVVVDANFLGLGELYARMLGAMLQGQGAQALPWKMMPPDMDPAGAIQSEAEKTLSDKEALEHFINDRVFDDAFWDELCVESSIVTGQTDHYALDAETFIRAVGERMFHFSQREVDRAVRGRRLVKDGKEWSDAAIEEGAPRYVWMPQRVRVFSKGGLIRLPTYLVKREAD